MKFHRLNSIGILWLDLRSSIVNSLRYSLFAKSMNRRYAFGLEHQRVRGSYYKKYYNQSEKKSNHFKWNNNQTVSTMSITIHTANLAQAHCAFLYSNCRWLVDHLKNPKHAMIIVVVGFWHVQR